MTAISAAPLAQVFAAADAGVPLGAPAQELITVPLDRIVPSRWQPRQQFTPAALLELALDIELHGVLTPPLVWRNEDLEYELIAGERRIRACYALYLFHESSDGRGYSSMQRKLDSWIEQAAAEGFVSWRDQVARLLANSSRAPQFQNVLCREIWGTSAQLHELALVDNLQREDLSPLEEAHALQDLMQEYGYSQRDLAGRLGKSQTWISQRLTLLNLAPAVADQVTGGEVDSATAREIARLAPEVQGQAVAHLQKHGMKSKAAQGFVQKVLDLSDPEHYAAPGNGSSQSPAATRLVGIALSEIPDPAARQAAVVAAAANVSDGKLSESLDRRDLLAASGIAGVGKTRYDIDVAALWQTHAPAAGYGCATCQLNAQRTLVEEINELAVARKESNRGDEAWPRCAPGVDTCRAYSAPGAAVSLAMCWLGGSFTLTPEEQGHISDVWPKRADDVAIWAAVIRRYYAADVANAARQHDAEENGLQRAVARYLTLQRSGELAPPANAQHQPCNKCVFHKVDADDPDAHCQFQANPPNWHDYDTAVIRLWESGNAVIGRCRLFRLKQPEINLPELPGGIELEPDSLLYLLRRMSAQENYTAARFGPRWIDAKRSHVQTVPSWSACEPVLKKLLPELSPGRRLALLLLWEDPFNWLSSYKDEKPTVEACVPELGRVVPYTLKETICR